MFLLCCVQGLCVSAGVVASFTPAAIVSQTGLFVEIFGSRAAVRPTYTVTITAPMSTNQTPELEQDLTVGDGGTALTIRDFRQTLIHLKLIMCEDKGKSTFSQDGSVCEIIRSDR